jgi:hypothetical protein
MRGWLMDEPLLIGNNMALLVAAAELDRRGRRSILMTDGKPLGGHFAGAQIGGARFDVGMMLLEKLAPSVAHARLDSYDPRRRNDWTRFADRAAVWLDACEPLLRAPTPQSLVEGRYVPDHLIANRLDVFQGSRVQALPRLDRNDPRHAAHKTTGAAYDRLSYADAARANHGDALQSRFIEPFVRKLTGHGSEVLLARYHRAAWVPLYYPETLSAAMRGDSDGLAEYPFWTNRTGCVGDLVARLCDQVSNSNCVRIVAEPLSSTHAADGRWCVATPTCNIAPDRIALGLTVERARALFGLAPRPAPLAASVVVMFCLVRSEAIRRHTSCLMVVDEEFATYRVTDQDVLADRDPPWHRVVIESSPDSLLQLANGQTQEAILLHELRQLLSVVGDDAVQVLKTVTARNALALPTADEVDRCAADHEELASVVPGAQLTGCLLGYGAMSMNDQVIQGLKIAEEFA